MTKMIEIVENCAAVDRVRQWNDRYYVNLSAPRSGCNGDRTTKIWIKGDTLTVEGGKGYRSDGFNAALTALENDLTAAGAERKGYSGTVDATFTL